MNIIHRKKNISILRKNKKFKIPQKALRYFSLSLIITLLVFSYPSWLLVNKYQLIKSLQSNISAINEFSDDNITNIDENLNTLQEKANDLQNEGSSSDNELKKIIGEYEQVLSEYEIVLSKSENSRAAQSYMVKQNEEWHKIDLSEIALSNVDLNKRESINKAIKERKSLKDRSEQLRKNLEINFDKLKSETKENFSLETNSQINSYNQLLASNLDYLISDTNSILELLNIYQEVLENNENLKISQETEDVNTVSKKIIEQGNQFISKGKEMKANSTSPQVKALINSGADLIILMGEVNKRTGEAIINNTSLDLNILADIKNIEEDIKIANNSIDEYYMNLDNQYNLRYESLKNKVIDLNLLKQLSEKKAKLDFVRNKLDAKSEKMQDSTILNILLD